MTKKILKQSSKKIKDGVEDFYDNRLYIYRYDLFSIVIIIICIITYFSNLITPGQVVFSDIDFPFYSKGYIDEVLGLWNQRWNTTAMLNIPRLPVVLPIYFLSSLVGYNGRLMLKIFILSLAIISGLSMYLLAKRLVSVYMGKKFDLVKVFAIIYGSLLYSLNPYFIFRIQHIYLLVGYSLFPLIILFFFKVFDHKFLSQIIYGFSPYDKKINSRVFANIFVLALLITVASSAIHYFFYTVILLGMLFVLLTIKYIIMFKKYNDSKVKKIMYIMFKKLLVLGTVFLGLSFYWLFIYFGSIVFGVQASQNNVNLIDTYVLFSKNSSAIKVAYLISYWWPMFDLGKLPISFYIGGGVVLLFVLLGIISSIRKHNIILFFSLLLLGTFVFATGVYYPKLAPLFIGLNKFPVIGSMFRDPNKLCGLIVLYYSVMLVFGIEKMLNFAKKLHLGNLILVSAMIVISASMFFYLIPMKELYVDRYLMPVNEPTSMIEFRKQYENTDHYGLYLPNADQMIRPYSGVSTPAWNKANNTDDTKATGDIYIYNSVIPTVFHHEGNYYGIGYYLDYIQTLLDEGRSSNIANYVKSFGTDRFIYIDGYLDQSERQSFNKQILKIQNGLTSEYKNDLYNVYSYGTERSNLVKENISENRIFTTEGYEVFEGLNQLTGYDPLNNPTVFINQNKSDDINHIMNGDIINTKNIDDFINSQYPSKYYYFPFDSVSEGDPFLKWSKTLIKGKDWTWYLKSQGLERKSYDFDMDKGVVLSFVSKKLNLSPYIKNKVTGELIVDFETILRNDSFFVPDNPDIFDVRPNPYSMRNDIQTIHGVVLKGEPENIWQVAKSSMIRAKEETPYRYNIVVSGRGANKIHLKARFYNDDEKEIGVQYIVAPEEVIDFDTINFTGEVISPKGSKYMRLDLLTFENPKSKSYWWIHDINIYDLSEFRADNVIEDVIKMENSGNYLPKIRLFLSPNGGEVKIMLGDSEYLINTRTDEWSGFAWIEMGEVFLTETTKISIENFEGFNSINSILFVPKTKMDELTNPILKSMQKGEQLIIIEGEKDFEHKKFTESKRLYPILSFGEGITVNQGTLHTSIDIIKDGYYILEPRVFFKDTSMGAFTIKISSSTDGEVYSKEYSKRTIGNMYDSVVNFTPLSNKYLYEMIEKKYTSFNSMETDRIFLPKGNYDITVQINSQNSSIVGLNDLYKTLGDDFKSSDIDTKDQINCSSCEKITEEMFRAKLESNTLTIEYDPTCSCDWYIYSSREFDVNELDELLVEYDAISENVNSRHGKIVFVDKFGYYTGTAYINEVEEKYKNKLNHYSQIVEVPSGAVSGRLQILCRGDKENIGVLKVSNLKIERYEKSITFDNLKIYSEKIDLGKSDFKSYVQEVDVTDMTRDFKLIRAIEDNSSYKYFNSLISPHNIWKLNNDSYAMVYNGVTAAYKIDLNNQQFTLSMKLGKEYKLGILLFFATIIGSFIFYYFRSKS